MTFFVILSSMVNENPLQSFGAPTGDGSEFSRDIPEIDFIQSLVKAWRGRWHFRFGAERDLFETSE
jgi:hypothetical protein